MLLARILSTSDDIFGQNPTLVMTVSGRAALKLRYYNIYDIQESMLLLFII